MTPDKYHQDLAFFVLCKLGVGGLAIFGRELGYGISPCNQGATAPIPAGPGYM